MVTLKVKENSKKAKAFIEFARSLSFVDFIEEKQPTVKLSKAIKESRECKNTKAKNVTDLIKKLK